jgi:hypothetical protein
MKAALARVPAFEMTLGPPAWFGADLLFLAVRSDAVIGLHQEILACLARAGIAERWEYDGDVYEPHLTLAATFAGATPGQLQALAKDAARLEPPQFKVEKLWVFHRPHFKAEYEPRVELTLMRNPVNSDSGSG